MFFSMDDRFLGSKLKTNNTLLKGGKATQQQFPVLKYNGTAFRNHADWVSVVLTEKTEMMLAFICQCEVSAMFGSSNSTV